MTDRSWQVADSDADEATVPPQTTLVSLHFLLAALRRHWAVWVGLAMVGMLLGAVWTVVIPPQSKGTVTLLLAHDPNANPDQALATDLSMLRTRTVARTVIDELDLETTPSAFLKTLVVNPLSSNVVVLEVTGPDDGTTLSRTRTLANAFLTFRSEQIRTRSGALIQEYENRLAALEQELTSLTNAYEALRGEGSANQNEASDLLAQRSQVATEINGVQQVIQDTRLTSNSVVAASHVLDPPALVPPHGLLRLGMIMGSGLIGGTALGIGLVIFTALSSDRLRRRDEVAAALGTTVRLSMGHAGVEHHWTRRFRHRSSSDRDLEILVRRLDSTLALRKRPSRKNKPARFALAAVDNVEAAAPVVGLLAVQLARRGLSVFVVDLSESGGLAHVVGVALDRHDQQADPSPTPTVFRPDGVPSLARGPVGATAAKVGSDLPSDDPSRSSWEGADVILTLAEVDPAVGVDHLRTWADQVIVMVTSGRSSAERLRTTGDLIRAAGLKLPFAVMVGVDRYDESSGLPEALEATANGARRTS
jgi:hypothetical protein